MKLSISTTISYKDKKLMTGLGVDGVLYTFEVVPRKAIPYFTSLSKGYRKRSQNFLGIFLLSFRYLKTSRLCGALNIL